jgi:hypothetical protein
MVERRTSQRNRVLKAATISFNQGGGIDCTVRNLSTTGASLEVASLFGIPDDFILTIRGDHVQHPCRVVWRKQKRLGVIFK